MHKEATDASGKLNDFAEVAECLLNNFLKLSKRMLQVLLSNLLRARKTKEHGQSAIAVLR